METQLAGKAGKKRKGMSRVRMHPAKQVPKFQPLVKLEEGAALTPPLVERSQRPQCFLCSFSQGECRNSFYRRGNLYVVNEIPTATSK